MLFLVCEILGIYINKSEKLDEILLGYASRMQKSKVLFFASEFSFIYLNFIVFGLEKYNFLTISLYLLYAFDLLYRVYLCDKIIKGEQNDDIKFILNSKIYVSLKTRFLISLSVSIVLYMAL